MGEREKIALQAKCQKQTQKIKDLKSQVYDLHNLWRLASYKKQVYHKALLSSQKTCRRLIKALNHVIAGRGHDDHSRPYST